MPVTLNVNEAEPTATAVCDSEMMVGERRLVAGAVMVKGKVFDVPGGVETETPATPGNAASVAKIAAVSCVEPTVVARAELFQLTIEPFTKFVPFTVSVRPLGLQYGVEGIEVVDAARDEIVGATATGAEKIVKKLMFDTSPGISTATCTAPGVARSEAC
jgi:hypothetical protein